jgi:hypothetical protein
VPEVIPAQPTPAMARPAISTLLVGATAQIKEPSSKMEIAMSNVFLASKVD